MLGPKVPGPLPPKCRSRSVWDCNFKRRAEEPGAPVRQLLHEVRERGYQGSSNLLVRYINQGRLDSDRPHPVTRRAARILLTRPDRLAGGQAETLARIGPPAPR